MVVRNMVVISCYHVGECLIALAPPATQLVLNIHGRKNCLDNRLIDKSLFNS